MVCAKCARQIDAGARSCPACASDPLLGGRYRLDRVLVEDSRGVSYRATRAADGLLVRARILTVSDATTPRELDHPALPRLIDGRKDSRWTIHEHVAGQTLAARLDAEAERSLDRGWLLTLLERVAEVLVYLHGREPPIAHGGLSLDTIVVRPGAPCSISLLDLARVGDASGCAPTPAADVRALGIVALQLLAGERVTPDDAERLRARVDDHELSALLARMLEPDGTQRIASPELREAVVGLHSSRQSEGESRSRPTPSSGDSLEPRSPPTANAPAKPAPRFMMFESTTPRPSPTSLHPGHVSGRSHALRRDSVRAPRNEDIPVMRPDELSRELSQAHRATSDLEQRQRKQLNFARVLVMLIAATITALATYIATTI